MSDPTTSFAPDGEGALAGVTSAAAVAGVPPTSTLSGRTPLALPPAQPAQPQSLAMPSQLPPPRARPHPDGMRGTHGSRPLGVVPYLIGAKAKSVEMYSGVLYCMSQDRGSLLGRRAAGYKRRFCSADAYTLSVWGSQEAWAERDYSKQKMVIHYRDMFAFVPAFTAAQGAPGEYHIQAVRSHGGALWNYFGFYTSKKEALLFAAPSYVDYDGWTQFIARYVLDERAFVTAFPETRRSIAVQAGEGGAPDTTSPTRGYAADAASLSPHILSETSPLLPLEEEEEGEGEGGDVTAAPSPSPTLPPLTEGEGVGMVEVSETTARLALCREEFSAYLHASLGLSQVTGHVAPSFAMSLDTTVPQHLKEHPLVASESQRVQHAHRQGAVAAQQKVAQLEALLHHKDDVIERMRTAGMQVPSIRWADGENVEDVVEDAGHAAPSAEPVQRQTAELKRLRKELQQYRTPEHASLTSELLRKEQRLREAEARLEELEAAVDVDSVAMVKRLQAELLHAKQSTRAKEHISRQRLSMAQRSRDAMMSSVRDELSQLHTRLDYTNTSISALHDTPAQPRVLPQDDDATSSEVSSEHTDDMAALSQAVKTSSRHKPLVQLKLLGEPSTCIGARGDFHTKLWSDGGEILQEGSFDDPQPCNGVVPTVNRVWRFRTLGEDENEVTLSLVVAPKGAPRARRRRPPAVRSPSVLDTPHRHTSRGSGYWSARKSSPAGLHSARSRSTMTTRRSVQTREGSRARASSRGRSVGGGESGGVGSVEYAIVSSSSSSL